MSNDPLELPAGACLDVIAGETRAGREAWFVRAYHIGDTFKDTLDRGGTLAGQPLVQWLAAVGAKAEDIWADDIPPAKRSLWDARVFPAVDSPQGYRDWLWMFDPATATAAQKAGLPAGRSLQRGRDRTACRHGRVLQAKNQHLMRYALIIAGGSGTRLWPMSRGTLPKQLIPFISGKSLLEIAYERLEGLVPADRRFICAGEKHAQVILDAIPGLTQEQFLGEPTGRDTVNAVGFGAAVIAKHDPDAVIAVFTADHLIRPVDRFQQIIAQGFEVAENHPETLVTFGIAPTQAATGYGYLELGEPLGPTARVVERFKEKPDEATAQGYFAAGPDRYLWNSGMFVWRAETLLECLRRYEPASAAGLARVAEAWGSARSGRRAQRGLSDVAEGERRFCRDGARLARSELPRGGRADAAGVARHRILADVRRDLPPRRAGQRPGRPAARAGRFPADARGFLRPAARDRHDRLRGHAHHPHARRHAWSAAPTGPRRSRRFTGWSASGLGTEYLVGRSAYPIVALHPFENASTANSKSSRLWTAETCVRMRALPCGTTG